MCASACRTHAFARERANERGESACIVQCILHEPPAGAVSLFARDTALHLMQFESRGRRLGWVVGGPAPSLAISHSLSQNIVLCN